MRVFLQLILITILNNALVVEPRLFEEVSVEELSVAQRAQFVEAGFHPGNSQIVKVNVFQLHQADQVHVTLNEEQTITFYPGVFSMSEEDNFIWRGEDEKEKQKTLFSIRGEKVSGYIQTNKESYSLIPVTGPYHLLQLNQFFVDDQASCISACSGRREASPRP